MQYIYRGSSSVKKKGLMGSSNSRLGSRPPRTPRATTTTTKRTLSSIFLCGASTSSAEIEMEDDPAELLVKSAERNDPVDDKFQSHKEFVLTPGSQHGFISPIIETAASSDSSVVGWEDSYFEDGSGSVETSNKGKCLSESKVLVPPQLSADHRSSHRASTSYDNRPISDLNFANGGADMNFVSGTNDKIEKDVSQIKTSVTQPSSLSPQLLGDIFPDGMAVPNPENEVIAIHNSDSGSASVMSESSRSFESIRDDILGSVPPADVVRISSNIMSSGATDISTRESRRTSRRLFWDAFSRRNTRRHSDSRPFNFPTDDSDDLGPPDRWLLDFGGDLMDDEFRGDSRYFGSRTHNINEQRRHARSEIWERFRGSIDGIDRRTSICPSGIHLHGTCSCESIPTADNSGPHASISRIVMLAEALFEVLDEIHRQPVSLSLSMVSLPAPESIVDSLPVKNHKNKHKTGTDVEQCYICLAEYEEGDTIRVLPCQHEYHMSCVDKWLKEIHGVCPLCRGDVCGTEASVSNRETPSA